MALARCRADAVALPLAEDLAGLDADRWATPSLCGGWTVEEVVAHLTAAADRDGVFRGFSSG